MDASSREECLPGTQCDVLQLMFDWASKCPTEQNILWIHGLSGSGKSTLATTFANRLRNYGQLGAFLFFDRNVAERSDPTAVVRTIACQLGMFHSQMGTAICNVIENNPNICSLPIDLQFDQLLVDPLCSVPGFGVKEPVIFVLDALDECGDPKERRRLLKILAKKAHNLPFNVRIVITSSADTDICCI